MTAAEWGQEWLVAYAVVMVPIVVAMLHGGGKWH